ncbi:DUF3558 domain-containing protein [Gordonia sp. ABSL1-1]|uniref:DUF3558 domain-containing protein n=1 Tax=Gordonia sp. ABSL1-1 TaxID=3053923 RepID=UPI00257299B4|nr:DUF3558 domain-containing protein [Gordonia sp. ABSL1-1]MDL9936558.1 DUF3558 domain-containing protein [Gordonia sp. ABSL1-1]
MNRRVLAVLLALLLVFAGAVGCARTVDGQAVSADAGGGGDDTGNVDTDEFDKLTLECAILSEPEIAKAVGGTSARSTFNGAICRWIVNGPALVNVTFNWFEWGDYTVEKDVAKRLGYQTENIKVASQVAFTQVNPKRPGSCGVTTRAPSRGIYTWWVESSGSTGTDSCAAATKLMELVLHGGQ